MKICKWCGAKIEYSASAMRGAWYSKTGRICSVASEEFDGAISHYPKNEGDN